MDPINFFVEYWGITSEHLIMIGGVTYLLIEALKKRLPDVFKGGTKTMIMAAVVTLGLSYKAFYPNWESIFVCAIVCWLIPEGIHAARSNGGSK